MIVWNKDNGGIGPFYQVQAWLVFAWKHGTAHHTNTFELADTGATAPTSGLLRGQYHEVRGAERIGDAPNRKAGLLVADAIGICSKRKGIVLEPFCGSGTTIIAAEKTGRRAAPLSSPPIRRSRRAPAGALAGKTAVLDGTGQTSTTSRPLALAANDGGVARKEVA